MEVIGKLKVKGEVQTFGSNGFQKRDIVITTDEKYPQQIAIELHQDKCDLINPYDVGHNIKTSINLRGREWINPQGEAKYFNSLVGWRIEKAEEPNTNIPPAEEFNPVSNDAEPDDLPF